jgi:hypothetical protein
MPSLRGVWENVIAGLLGLAIVAASAWAASTFDAPIALWGVVLIAVVSFSAGVGLGRVMRFGEDLLGYQADLLGEAILGLREIAAGHLDISFEEFIERGVLAPARFGISWSRATCNGPTT